MKIISVMSPKGGTGKTTTTNSIAYILATEHKKRVLILDGDPQADTSRTFDVYEPDEIGMSEMLEKHELVNGPYKTKDLIKNTEYAQIDVIPANGYLMRTDMNLLLQETDDQVTRLRMELQEVKDMYDYCICDCGRLFDMVVLNMLIASELVIAPVKPGGFEVRALQNLQEQVLDLLDINPDLKIKGLLVMKQKNNTHSDVYEWLENECEMFSTTVRRSIVVEKASIAAAPVPAFSKRCVTTQDYRHVVEELLQDLEG